VDAFAPDKSTAFGQAARAQPLVVPQSDVEGTRVEPTRRRKLWPQAMDSCWAERVRGIINGETDTLWEDGLPYSRQRCRCRPGSFWSTSQ
jgi:hypothetical protein